MQLSDGNKRQNEATSLLRVYFILAKLFNGLLKVRSRNLSKSSRQSKLIGRKREMSQVFLATFPVGFPEVEKAFQSFKKDLNFCSTKIISNNRRTSECELKVGSQWIADFTGAQKSKVFVDVVSKGNLILKTLPMERNSGAIEITVGQRGDRMTPFMVRLSAQGSVGLWNFIFRNRPLIDPLQTKMWIEFIREFGTKISENESWDGSVIVTTNNEGSEVKIVRYEKN